MAGDIVDEKNKSKQSNVKLFNCPSCGSGVVIRAIGQSISVVCGSCSAIIDSNNENYKVIAKSSQSGTREQIIEIGQRGKLHGVVWEVIGYIEKSDKSSVYTWSEYLLFNPLKGFRWLTEFDGHWNYVITIKAKPSETNFDRGKANYLNKDYFLFHRGYAKTNFIRGEFYWKVSQGDVVQVLDYVSPPEILSCEKNANETIWSLGQYIDAEEVKTAFKLTKRMPVAVGVAPNQLSTFGSDTHKLKKVWGAFLALLFLMQFCNLIFSKNQTVFSDSFQTNLTDVDKVKVTPQFELKHGISNVEITMQAPVQNNWLEIQGDLVNDDTGETLGFEVGVEYYSGYDSDGSWSEGSRSNEIILSAIPDGKYHLNLESSSESSAALTGYSIILKRDVTIWSNFWWCVFLISFYPIFAIWRSHSFELDRWSQSDFSPYYQHREE